MSADEDILDILLNIYPEECFIAKAETLGLCHAHQMSSCLPSGKY